MGLFSRFKSPKATPTIRLPFAEPGIKAAGSHYFEENISKVPPGKPGLQLVAAPDADWGKVQVLWEGLRIGNLSLDEQQERALLKVLLQLGPAGTVFTAEGETVEERVLDLNVKDSKLASRKRIRVMIPLPQRLNRWIHASEVERAGLKLSEPTAVKVRLKGQGPVQGTLEKLAAGKDEFKGKASISIGSEASGKYKGGPTLTFSVKGDTIGVVGARYEEEEPELFSAALSGSLKTVDLSVLRSSFGENTWYSTVSFSVD